MKKRVLAMLLTLAMTLSLLPVSAMAAEERYEEFPKYKTLLNDCEVHVYTTKGAGEVTQTKGDKTFVMESGVQRYLAKDAAGWVFKGWDYNLTHNGKQLENKYGTRYTFSQVGNKGNAYDGNAAEIQLNRLTTHWETTFNKLYYYIRANYNPLITASAGEHGSISKSDQVEVEYGKSETFTFTPEKGYVVDKVKVDDKPVSVSENKYTFENVTAPHTIQVTYKKSEVDTKNIHVKAVVNGAEVNTGEVKKYLTVSPSGEKATFDEATDDISYKFENYNCKDTTFEAKLGYAIEGISAEVVYGQSGWKGFTDSSATKCTVDNIAGGSTVTVYLRTAYAVKYYQDETPLTGAAYTDNNLYAAAATELTANSEKFAAPSGDSYTYGPENEKDARTDATGNQPWFERTFVNNAVNQQITLPALPAVAEGRTNNGWFKTADGTEESAPETTVNVAEFIPTSGSGNVISFYARSSSTEEEKQYVYTYEKTGENDYNPKGVILEIALPKAEEAYVDSEFLNTYLSAVKDAVAAYNKENPNSALAGLRPVHLGVGSGAAGYDGVNGYCWHLDFQREYTLTYDANGGTPATKVDGTKYIAGETAELNDTDYFAVREKDGVAIVQFGWTDTPTAKIYDKGEAAALPMLAYAVSFTFPTAGVSGDKTVYAVWGYDRDGDGKADVLEETHTVTFDSKGGSAIVSQNVVDGGKAVKPNNPTLKGYTFTGWTLNGEPYKFNTPVTEDITLVAQWAADILDDKDDNTTDGDGIADKYQSVLTFKVVNGSWNDGKVADVVLVVTLKDANGELSENGTYALTKADIAKIPAAGEKPDSGYKAGSWDKKLPVVGNTVEANATYTYTYAKKSTGGGSSSGGSDKLNTKDHYSYIIGYKDGDLKPYGTITRGEVATIFFRLLTDDAREDYWATTNSYSDVPADLWCNNAISTLSNMGIIDGFQDGTFRPYAKITRAQFAKMAVGFFDAAEKEYRGYFVDVPENAWYTAYVESAVREGLIQGFEDETFRPNVNITRAQACVIVNRAIDRKPDEDHLLPERKMITWPDCSEDDWFYADMMEATNSHDYTWTTEKIDGERVKVEKWTKKLAQRDWAAFENMWADANSAPGGEVID